MSDTVSAAAHPPVRWDAGVAGLAITFVGHDGEEHHSLLGWSQLDRMRRLQQRRKRGKNEVFACRPEGAPHE